MARKRSLPAAWLIILGMPGTALFLFLLGKVLSR